MQDIIWEEPPLQSRRGRGDRVATLLQIRDHPGRWARLGTWYNKATAQQAASDVRRGRTVTVQPGTVGYYEAEWGDDGGGAWAVWVRWVPAEPPTTPA